MKRNKIFHFPAVLQTNMAVWVAQMPIDYGRNEVPSDRRSCNYKSVVNGPTYFFIIVLAGPISRTTLGSEVCPAP